LVLINTCHSFDIERCGEKEICSAVNWESTAFSEDAAKCIEGTIPSLYDSPEVTPNGSLDGDYCNESADCFNNAEGVVCKSNTCVTNVRVGDDCTKKGQCPRASYCSEGGF